MMDTQMVKQRQWTDWAVLVGLTAREVQAHYEYLRVHRPETLLGYRVLLTTSDQLLNGATRGLMALKVVVHERAYFTNRVHAAYDLNEAYAVTLAPWPDLVKFEIIDVG